MLTTSVIWQADEEVSVKRCLKDVRCFSSKTHDLTLEIKGLILFFAEVVGYGMELLYSAPHL